mmetsp:Transcript_52630/g.125738  ORF Transcript_52630/g.125738 Transcript_52630/m.125738 type:complete len:312 (-) Transcript_52630:325-1260(-)|eukprot:CAMPEP_0178414462 /NCGR_PEP_ID=MMETSP0689_2-20121128/23048_1 /TAXON_ID=160604 /ORGANISM="Amphidinium massartii, Strain CS-259" /LENGTH=311 /DNA_ID=CAMNT_0020035751 /DNA_START=127 /DNA_END=1062 /DNA_ORIENTATION=-
MVAMAIRTCSAAVLCLLASSAVPGAQAFRPSHYDSDLEDHHALATDAEVDLPLAGAHLSSNSSSMLQSQSKGWQECQEAIMSWFLDNVNQYPGNGNEKKGWFYNSFATNLETLKEYWGAFFGIGSDVGSPPKQAVKFHKVLKYLLGVHAGQMASFSTVETLSDSDTAANLEAVQDMLKEFAGLWHVWIGKDAPKVNNRGYVMGIYTLYGLSDWAKEQLKPKSTDLDKGFIARKAAMLTLVDQVAKQYVASFAETSTFNAWMACFNREARPAGQEVDVYFGSIHPSWNDNFGEDVELAKAYRDAARAFVYEV